MWRDLTDIVAINWQLHWHSTDVYRSLDHKEHCHDVKHNVKGNVFESVQVAEDGSEWHQASMASVQESPSMTLSLVAFSYARMGQYLYAFAIRTCDQHFQSTPKRRTDHQISFIPMAKPYSCHTIPQYCNTMLTQYSLLYYIIYSGEATCKCSQKPKSSFNIGQTA